MSHSFSSGHLGVLRQIWNAPGNASNRSLAVLRALRWFVACRRKRATDDRPVLCPVFGNRVYPCYRDSIIAKHVMYRSEWFDYDLLKFMQDYLRPVDHFLDVGANTGLHTLLASTLITEGRITCVEPDPTNASRLRHALDLNHVGNATILPVAASDAPGRVSLEGSDVFSRIAPEVGTTSAAREVESVRLDAALGPEARIEFCKIDVEGAEWQVLKGMTGLMDGKALPVIAFEFNGNLQAYGHSESSFLSWLKNRGYAVASYHHDRRMLTFADEFPTNSGDLFAMTREGRVLVNERMPGLRQDMPLQDE